MNCQATLTVTVPGLHVLCYYWSSNGATLVQPHIRVAAMWVHTIWPRGTGLGCATNLTLQGAGFTALKDDTPRADCHFTYPHPHSQPNPDPHPHPHPNPSPRPNPITPTLTRRELPPGVRARLGMYFYIAVALTSLALFVLQLSLRFPGYLRFQVSVKG